MKPSPVPTNARVGIVLATHAAVPYVHLHLECLKHHEPNVNVLIHDDCSEKLPALRDIAESYGAQIVSTDYRKAATVGDLSSFAEGLRWGEMVGLDVVVKCSRRFIIDKPWSVGLVELMHNTGYACACAPCANFNFGFRSEVVAMHVPSWIAAGIMQEMAGLVAANREYGFPEAFDHHKAREVHRFIHPIASVYGDANNPDCDFTLRSEGYFARPDNYSGYAWWTNVMGLARTQQIPNVYWHDSHTPPDYAQLAMKYGLPYTPEDFVLQPRQ